MQKNPIKCIFKWRIKIFLFYFKHLNEFKTFDVALHKMGRFLFSLTTKK